jgi:non-ribosomal peptide synthetase component F
VPLDPAYPAARLEFMVKDSGTTALLTTRALAATIQWPDNVSVICMDEPAENENGARVTSNPPRLAKSTYAVHTFSYELCFQPYLYCLFTGLNSC